MTDAPRPPRILIAACCYADALPAIRVGTDLARHLGGEIVAILAEDEAIQRTAALPFAKAISQSARTAQAITPQAMRDAFLRDAGIMRETLARLTAPSAIGWSFEHRQGPALRLLREIAATGDILLLGHERASRLAGEIVLIDPSDPVEPRLLDLGLHIARQTGRPLRLFVPSTAAPALRQTLAAQPTRTIAVIEDVADQANLNAYLVRERPVALLIASSAGQQMDIEATLARARCPVIIAADGVD